MEQEFVTLPREVVDLAIEALFCTDSEEGSTAYENELKAVKKLRAALEQPKNHIPDAGNMVTAGWKLVPVEPNCSMVLAGERSLEQHDFLRLDSAYRAMLAAAPQPPVVEQPQANQPAMTPIAQRKLDSLLAEGYTISGYSVYHEQKHQHGFVTGAGLVGWWRPDGMEYPQPRGEQDLQASDAYDMIDRHLRNNLHDDDYSEYSAALDSIYTHSQSKPLTDEQIKGMWAAACGTPRYNSFARALESAHNIK